MAWEGPEATDRGVDAVAGVDRQGLGSHRVRLLPRGWRPGSRQAADESPDSGAAERQDHCRECWREHGNDNDNNINNDDNDSNGGLADFVMDRTFLSCVTMTACNSITLPPNFVSGYTQAI